MPETFSIALSPLESQRFGVVTARADNVTSENVSALLSFYEQHDVDLVIARCDALDVVAVRALAEAGLVQLEAQISFVGPLRGEIPAISVRKGLEGDRDAIADLAQSGFENMPSHYHADPRLSLKDCLETYVDWSLRGLRGEAADAFFVTEVEGRPAGFMMFAIEGEQIKSLLSTVDYEVRGRGLYQALMLHGMKWGMQQGATSVLGITPHGNVAAQRNLIKLGLAPTGSTATFHGWRDQLKPAS